MKNNIFLSVLRGFFVVVVLSALSSLELRGAERSPEDFLSDYPFHVIMDEPWGTWSQSMLHDSWDDWDDSQKQAILQRMQAQGLLSQSQVENWDMDVIPTPTMGG